MIIITLAIILAIIVAVFCYFYVGKAPVPKNVTWGVDFSQMQAQSLGLDWKQTYSAIINDLGAKNIKIHTQWDWIEGKKGEYYFGDTDWQLNQAKENGVKQFILISSLAVTKPEHPMNKYGQVLMMKLEGENEVRRLFSEPGYSYTILRPGGLIDGPPMNHDLYFDTGDKISTGVIDRSDVAEVAVISLFTPEAHNLTFELIQSEKAPQSSLKRYFKHK